MEKQRRLCFTPLALKSANAAAGNQANCEKVGGIVAEQKQIYKTDAFLEK